MSDQQKIHQTGFWITAGFIYALIFYHFRFRINPALIYKNQDPVFFTNLRFFHPFTEYPGGFAEYAAAFLSQFFINPWAGALILVILIGSIQALSALLFRRIADDRTLPFASFIPAIFIAVMLSHYHFPLATAAGLITALFFAYLILTLKNWPTGLLSVFLFGATALTYYLAGGPFLMFIAMSALAVWSVKNRSVLKQGILSLILILAGGIVPWLMNPALGVMSPDASYLRGIPRSISFAWPGVLEMAFGFIILWSMCLSFLKQWRKSRLSSLNRIWKTWPATLASILFVLWLAVLMIITTVDEKARSRLKIRLYAQQKRWEAVLDEIRRNPEIDDISAFHMHRALYHTGQLGDVMFRYPQNQGVDGLIPMKEAMLFHAVEAADFWFEIKHFNESEHWAHEAITQQGATPWIIARLAEINRFKGNRAMLQSMVNLLDQTLLQREWADRYRAALTDDALQSASKQAREQWIKTDFLIHLNLPEMDLVSLLRRNPKNHMAFEYLMSCYLLIRQLPWFVDEIEHIRDFPYNRLPLHWEEALLVYMVQTGRTDPVFAGFRISSETIQRFNDYQQIFSKYGGNRESAREELRRKYGGTYWYYLMYSESNMRVDTGEEVDASTGATQ